MTLPNIVRLGGRSGPIFSNDDLCIRYCLVIAHSVGRVAKVTWPSRAREIA